MYLTQISYNNFRCLEDRKIEFDKNMNIIDEIEKHRSDFGIDDSSLIYHKLNGANITALFPIFQTSPITLITQENLSTLDSLQNKNIEFSSNELVNISIKAILKSNNINIHQIAHSFYIDKFVLKESDGIVGYVSNQPFYLDEKNTKLEDEAFITTFKDLFIKGELEHTIKKEQRVVKGTYTLKVSYEKAYAVFKVNSKITLEELHDIIQEIIRFDNDHLYCFYIEDEMGSLNTYVSPEDMGNKYTDEIKIEELGLCEGKTFEYLFDYGDEWVFSIKVEKIDTIGVKIEEPLLMKIKGKFPEQYDF